MISVIEFVASVVLNHRCIIWQSTIFYKEEKIFMKKFIIAIIVTLCFSIPAFSISKQDAEKWFKFFLRKVHILRLMDMKQETKGALLES